MEYWEAEYQKSHDIEDYRRLFSALGELRNQYDELKNLKAAEDTNRRMIALSEGLAEETGTVDSRRDLALIYNSLGNLYKSLGDLDRAENFFRKSLALRKRLAEETGTVEAYYDLAVSYFNIAIIQKPYHWSLLEGALQITTALATQCPQVTQYSEFRDMIKHIFEQERNKMSRIL